MKRIYLGLAIFLATAASARAADTYIAPQYDMYITHNTYFRSHVTVSGNYLTRDRQFSSAWAHYDMDIGIVPFFRRYLYKDPNPEKSKRLSFRVGYLQVTDLKDDPNGFDEKRPLVEFLLRQPAGRAWLFEDRNRIEFRIFNDDNWNRYRNRLRTERSVVVRKARFTPYQTTELFYDWNTDRWNEVQAAIGVDIPFLKKMILELEIMSQIVEGDYASTSFGIVFQKFL